MAVVTYLVQVTAEPAIVIDGAGDVQQITWPVKAIGSAPGPGPTSVVMNRPVSPPPSYDDWGRPPWQLHGDKPRGDYHIYQQTWRSFVDGNHELSAPPSPPVTFEEGGVFLVEGNLVGSVVVVVRWAQFGHLKALHENGVYH